MYVYDEYLQRQNIHVLFLLNKKTSNQTPQLNPHVRISEVSELEKMASMFNRKIKGTIVWVKQR